MMKSVAYTVSVCVWPKLTLKFLQKRSRNTPNLEAGRFIVSEMPQAASLR